MRARLDLPGRIAGLWILSMWSTVLVGFCLLRFAPGIGPQTWTIGTSLNIALAIGCGAALTWHGRCAPIPAVALIGAFAVVLGLDLLGLADPATTSGSIDQLVVFDAIGTLVGFFGVMVLFALGAPFGLLLRLVRQPGRHRQPPSP